MNERSQVITGIEFNCAVVMQGTHHVLHLIKKCHLARERLANLTGAMRIEL